MVNLISELLPLVVLISNVLGAVLLVALLTKHSFGRGIVHWVGRHALTLGLLVALVAVSGSLFYSNVKGYTPCILCWWQRMAVYPLLVLFVVALWKKDRRVFRYVLPLSVIGLIISIYHSYVQWGGSPLIPCDATATCNKLYVFTYGYITIPTMVVSATILMILFYFANRVYENSHSR